MRSQSSGTPVTLLTVTGQTAKMHGKFEIADSLHVECEIGGRVFWGVGIDTNTVTASMRAVLSAVNRSRRG